MKEGEVFGLRRLQQIEALSDLYPVVINQNNFEEHADNTRDVVVIFCYLGKGLFLAVLHRKATNHPDGVRPSGDLQSATPKAFVH